MAILGESRGGRIGQAGYIGSFETGVSAGGQMGLRSPGR
jgi:hypothetical protein